MGCLIALEQRARTVKYEVVEKSVCLVGWLIRAATSCEGYEETCNGPLHVTLLCEYVCMMLLFRLVLEEPCLHSASDLV